MEEKKARKISLSTFFLIFAIIVIIVLSIFIFKIYNEKAEENQRSSDLQAQVNSLNETINNLQGKTNDISETINSNELNNSSIQNSEKNINYDVEVSLSEIENIQVSDDDTDIKDFYKKYKGKTIKVTGYVSSFGDEFDSELGAKSATGVNIGNSESYETIVYAYGVTYNSDIIEKIHKLKEGSKVSLIGTLSDSWSKPVEIHLTNIIE